jgi:hypothetical protein
VTAAQPPQLRVEVLGPLRAGAADALNAGRERLVLERVGLVAEHEVDARLLEGGAVVLLVGGGELSVARLEAGERRFEPLDGQSFAGRQFGDRGAELLHPFSCELGSGGGGERDPLEARVSEHDRVPGAGCAPGDELLAARGRRVFAGGDEHARARVELEQLAGELVEHVVGHDERRLLDETEATLLHRRHDHGRRLAGADGVREQRVAG